MPSPTDNQARPELDDDRHRVWLPSPIDPVLPKPQVAVGDRPAWARNAVDVDPRLGRAGELEPIREPGRRVPERGRAAIAVEETRGGPVVLGDDPGGKPGRLLVGDLQRLVDPVDQCDRDGRDALGVARPLVADRPVERLAAGNVAPHIQILLDEQAEQCREQLLCPAVDEREVEPVADAEPVEAGLGEARAPCRGLRRRARRARHRPRRGRASGRRSGPPAGRARRSLGPLPAQDHERDERGQRDEHARALAIRGAHESDRRGRKARCLERGAQHVVDEHGDGAERRAAGAEHDGVQALQQLAGDVERDVRPRLEVRADDADRDPPLRDDAGRWRASGCRSRARAASSAAVAWSWRASDVDARVVQPQPVERAFVESARRGLRRRRRWPRAPRARRSRSSRGRIRQRGGDRARRPAPAAAAAAARASRSTSSRIGTFVCIVGPAGGQSPLTSREAEGTGPVTPRQPAATAARCQARRAARLGGCRARGRRSVVRHRTSLPQLRDRARPRSGRHLLALLGAARPGLRPRRAGPDRHARVDRRRPAVALALRAAAPGRAAGRAAARARPDAARRARRDWRRRSASASCYLKLDTANPTHSFKDRVVAVATAKAQELGLTTLACSSTGNLANAVAARAAAEGLEAAVFCPADLEPEKLIATAVYGATLYAVDGTYDDCSRLTIELSFELPWAFVNVGLRSYYAEGSKTLAYEIAEQLGWELPDVVVAPIASGSLFTKLAPGLRRPARARARRGRRPAARRRPGRGLLAGRGGVRGRASP